MPELSIENEIKFEEKMARYWKNKQSKYKKQSNKDMCEKNIQWGLEEITKLKNKQAELATIGQ
jgi:hypothetical protein